jgi:type I restriction enzyme S subunit
MKYSAYPSYKDSGVEWLGDVPSEWNVVRNKQVFSFIKQLVGKKSEDYTLLSLTLQGIKVRDVESGKGKFPAEFDTYQSVVENDIVFCLFDIDETPRTVGISTYRGMITGAYNVARCNAGIVPRFMYYYYLAVDEYKGLRPFYTGLRKVVKTETFMNIKLSLPCYQEQQTIVNYLDTVIVKIDSIIKKQTKLIELLREKRQAVISTAVTRGLDSTVAMKDSGVEWLGDVPECWKVKKLNYIVDIIQTGTTPATSVSEYYDGNINWFNPTDLNNPILSNSSRKVTSKAINEGACKIFPRDSVLVVGIGATSGKTAYLDGNDSSFNQQITGFYSNKNYNKYLFYLLKNFSNVFLGTSNFTTLPILNNDFFKAFTVVIPAPEEQRYIAIYLDKKTQQIDSLTTKATKAIALLKEKRTVLISAAVTGKIDVREVA